MLRIAIQTHACSIFKIVDCTLNAGSLQNSTPAKNPHAASRRRRGIHMLRLVIVCRRTTRPSPSSLPSCVSKIIMALTKEEKKKLSWKHSDAKAALFKDIIDEVVPSQCDGKLTSTMIFEDRYKNHPAFQVSNFNNVKSFGNRLSALRGQIKEKYERADEDSMALHHDRQFYPKKTTDAKGLPIWKGSEAQRLLIEDLKKKKHKKNPMKLWLTEPEYQVCPLEIF